MRAQRKEVIPQHIRAVAYRFRTALQLPVLFVLQVSGIRDPGTVRRLAGDHPQQQQDPKPHDIEHHAGVKQAFYAVRIANQTPADEPD